MSIDDCVLSTTQQRALSAVLYAILDECFDAPPGWLLSDLVYLVMFVGTHPLATQTWERRRQCDDRELRELPPRATSNGYARSGVQHARLDMVDDACSARR